MSNMIWCWLHGVLKRLRPRRVVVIVLYVVVLAYPLVLWQLCGIPAEIIVVSVPPVIALTAELSRRTARQSDTAASACPVCA